MATDADDGTGGRHAFVFPGVGVTLGSHEATFFGRHEGSMRPRLEAAGARAGVDFVAGLKSGSVTTTPGLESQLFGYAFSVAVAEVVRAAGIEPRLTAGHSLGLYAALEAAGAIDFDDGLRITADAYECAVRSCAPGEHDLAAVVGFPRDELELLLREQGGPTLRIVNVNNPTSLLVAGAAGELDAFCELAVARGALKAPRLGAGLPYHHPELLAGAASALRERLGRVGWRSPRCPVISSIDGRPLREVDELVLLTARNVATPIDWHRVVETMAALGIELAVECGAGALLTQNSRLSGCGPRFLSLRLWADRWGL